MFEAICNKRHGKQRATPTLHRHSGATAATKGEDGFVLITVMFVMVLLLVLALAAADSVVLETTIAGNHQKYSENFYTADGATLEVVKLIAHECDEMQLNANTSSLSWIDNQKNPPLVDPDAAPDDAQTEAVDTQYDDPATWRGNNRPRVSALSDDKREVRQMVVITYLGGGDQGSSIVRGSQDNVIPYTAYGHSQGLDGKTAVAIAVGFEKRKGSCD